MTLLEQLRKRKQALGMSNYRLSQLSGLEPNHFIVPYMAGDKKYV